MATKNMFSVFVVTFLSIGFFFLALPEKGYSGVAVIATGCCIGENGCVNFGDGPIACLVGTVVDDGTCTVEGPDGICTNRITRSTGVPTLSEWGLIIMAGVLGVAGFMIVRKRKIAV